jgi:hypothetical protein
MSGGIASEWVGARPSALWSDTDAYTLLNNSGWPLWNPGTLSNSSGDALNGHFSVEDL